MDYEAMLDWLIEHRDDCHAMVQYGHDVGLRPDEIIEWKDKAKMVNQIIEIVRTYRDCKEV